MPLTDVTIRKVAAAKPPYRPADDLVRPQMTGFIVCDSVAPARVGGRSLPPAR